MRHLTLILLIATLSSCTKAPAPVAKKLGPAGLGITTDTDIVAALVAAGISEDDASTNVSLKIGMSGPPRIQVPPQAMKDSYTSIFVHICESYADATAKGKYMIKERCQISEVNAGKCTDANDLMERVSPYVDTAMTKNWISAVQMGALAASGQDTYPAYHRFSLKKIAYGPPCGKSKPTVAH